MGEKKDKKRGKTSLLVDTREGGGTPKSKNAICLFATMTDAKRESRRSGIARGSSFVVISKLRLRSFAGRVLVSASAASRLYQDKHTPCSHS